ncbi:outer membrane beta-barrel protein [Enterobacteriaceae endosymbiont of Donacia tomentosa]|uniref:outer membrane beta-barrel protein n=1 Tax=Enterobacteriaceae endosymbiont of Donacia tomentosa TaxID=2675787 RepID=UPI001448D029|nr:outer membrane beta-barrel protein [Enterobacteriaceae endosymbiont of Donacia tomentosa]QJC31626.1 outer membrane beta-barrel protein [Enterobacteriaceae endosymbiont of Donacia tomentosa]
MKKKTFIIIIIIMIIGVNNSFANAYFNKNNSYWYLGSKLGLSKYNNLNLFGNDIDNENYNEINKLGSGFFLGFQENRFLSFEIEYDWFGKLIKNINESNIINIFQSEGIQLTTKITYPIIENLDIYTRFGNIITRTKNIQKNKEQKINSIFFNASPILAIGSEYKTNNNWFYRFEYQWIHKIGDNKNLGQETSNSMFVLGLKYSFHNQDYYSSKRIPHHFKKYKNNNHNNINLKSRVYFKFDDFRLQIKGKKILNKLIIQANKNKRKQKIYNRKILILGHYDFFGNKKYNFLLAQKRINSIINYLYHKNIHLKKKNISIKILGNKKINKNCNRIRNFNLLKKCLYLDRYVEISIFYTKINKNNFFVKKLYKREKKLKNPTFNNCFRRYFICLRRHY